LTAKLLDFRQDIASLEIIPSGGGVYEIDVDGQRIYSKKETGEFPDEDAIVEQIRSLV
jgi:selenoprotein W-related protein